MHYERSEVLSLSLIDDWIASIWSLVWLGRYLYEKYECLRTNLHGTVYYMSHCWPLASSRNKKAPASPQCGMGVGEKIRGFRGVFKYVHNTSFIYFRVRSIDVRCPQIFIYHLFFYYRVFTYAPHTRLVLSTIEADCGIILLYIWYDTARWIELGILASGLPGYDT